MDDVPTCEMDPITWDALVSWMKAHGVADAVIGKVCGDAAATIAATPLSAREQVFAEAAFPEFVSEFSWDRRGNQATLEFVTDATAADLNDARFEAAEHPSGTVSVLFGPSGLVHAIVFDNADAQLSAALKAAAVKVATGA